MKHTEIPSLTALRGIAALVVIVFHSEVFFAPGSRMEDWFPPIYHGYLAVDFFFLLSGFVITHVYGSALAAGGPGVVGGFLRSRVSRLYPLHLLTLACLVAALQVWPQTLPRVSFDRALLPLSVVMQQGWAKGLNWNYPAWSIGDEALTYVAFIFLARLVMRKALWLPTAAASTAVLLSICLHRAGSVNVVSGMAALARTLAGFLLGSVLYQAWIRCPRAVLPACRMAVVPICLLAAVLGFDLLWITVFACITVMAAEAKGAWHQALNTGPLLWLGNVSFSMYLWHVPVQTALAGLLGRYGVDVGSLGIPASLAVSGMALTVVLLISEISYRRFERPVSLFIKGFGVPLQDGAG